MLQHMQPNHAATTAVAPSTARDTRIGHVHLKVADLERALQFYCGVLGFELTQRLEPQMAFVSIDGYHHLIGLNTRQSRGGLPPPESATGLYHFAILYPTRSALADATRGLVAADVAIDRASDHGISIAVYARDPDGTTIELCWDRPKEEWPRTASGVLDAFDKPLDWRSLLCATEPAA
jgi:catechol 2,3-dioxygenase